MHKDGWYMWLLKSSFPVNCNSQPNNSILEGIFCERGEHWRKTQWLGRSSVVGKTENFRVTLLNQHPRLKRFSSISPGRKPSFPLLTPLTMISLTILRRRAKGTAKITPWPAGAKFFLQVDMCACVHLASVEKPLWADLLYQSPHYNFVLNCARGNGSKGSVNPPPSLCSVPGRWRKADSGLPTSSLSRYPLHKTIKLYF